MARSPRKMGLKAGHEKKILSGRKNVVAGIPSSQLPSVTASVNSATRRTKMKLRSAARKASTPAKVAYARKQRAKGSSNKSLSTLKKTNGSVGRMEILQEASFLKLPREIRDMIYSECATVLEGYPIALFYKSKDHASCVRSDCHSLLQVCRQLRHEFLSTYYSNTNFQIQAKHLLRFNTLLSKVKAPSPPAIHAEIGCCTPVCVHSKDILQVMNFRVKHMKTSINLIGAKITRPIGIVDALGQRLIVTQPYHLDDREVEMWQKLVANTNRNWLGLFRERQLAGLMLARTGNCKVLMKCEHAPAWMKRNPSPPERDVLLYAEKLGFTKELMGRGSWPIFPANGPRLEFRVYYW